MEMFPLIWLSCRSWFTTKLQTDTWVEDWLDKKDHLFYRLMQTVSIALCSEMETEPCCEEHKDPAVESMEPEVREAISETADSDGHNELPCESAEEGELPFEEEQAETDSCAAESKNTEIKSPSDPDRESGETECKEQKKLKKTNSWKMVRFQDPSMDDDVLERDSSAESLFPEYAMKEWTSSTFEELFMAEDWQDITGGNTAVNGIAYFTVATAFHYPLYLILD